MKRWLMIGILMLGLFLTAVAAEDAVEHIVVYFNDGSMVLLPADIANDEQKLADYCEKYLPGRIYTLDAEGADSAYDAVISEKWAAERFGEGSRAMAVRLVKLGVYTSVVADTKGEELNVPTAELTIAGFGDKAHHVAVISAPRTGTASLREKAAGSGKVIAKCQAGRIVAVVEYTNAVYTKIRYDETEGYIRTDCLVFQNTAKAPQEMGVLHIKDAVDGKSDVTIRNTASKSTAKVVSVPTGTIVNVFGEEGDWFLVESDGWMGYVQKQYLKLNEE